jgi:DNA polymerase epsilon subunit 1
VPTCSCQTWRGEHYKASRSEYQHQKDQLRAETFPPSSKALEGGELAAPRVWEDLDQEEQDAILTARLKKYCQRVMPLPDLLN